MGPTSNRIYRVFYKLLHSVFTLYQLLESNLKTVRTKLLQLRPEPLLPPKTPKHVTIILGTEPPSYPDLANLILWCLTAGVPFISFHDHKGILKQNEDKLHRVVAENKHASDHVIWHSHPDKVYRNGFVGRKIHVKVLTHGEGRGGLVAAARKLAADDITSNELDREMQRLFEFPDPDLGVCCGETFSLYGYPPWQIRVTEFLTLGSHHGVQWETFVKLLCRFSKCEQRYGK